MKRSAIFLDRDGVLNRAIVEAGKPRPPRTAAEISIYGDAAPALAGLRKAGFLNIVVTNQPDVARGSTTREFVEAIHARLSQALAVDAIYVCWHDDADRCDCRKPRPGMLVQAARDFGIDLATSYMIGDRWRDIDAGRRAGCTTVFIDHRYEAERPEGQIDFTTENFGHAARWILDREAGKLHTSP